MQNRLAIPLTCLIALLLALPLESAAEPAVSIEKITVPDLQQRMQAKTGQCMVVAIASWCSPCRKELPVLNRLYAKYHEQGLQIVGVSVDADGPQALQPIVDKAGVNFPIYWVGEAAIEELGIYALPMMFLVKEGQTVEKIPGKRSAKYLEKKILKLLE